MFPDPLFSLFFVLIFIAAVASIILKIVSAIRSGSSGLNSSSLPDQPEVREREIIREIVKIKCPYCGQLYDQKEDKCPNCGARTS
jgi:hypothetical protein